MTGNTFEHNPDDDQNGASLDEAGKARQAHDLTNAIVDKRFGDMVEYQRERVIAEAQFYLGQSAAAMLEAGKRLILLKEHEPHGEFTAAVESLGLTVRTAQKFMQASLKFGNSKASTLTHLNKSKLLLLAMEDQDDIDGLAEGGTIADLNLDDIDKMSVRELRKSLRKSQTDHQQDREAQTRLLTDKNSKIDELDAANHALRNRSKPWPQRVLSISIEVNEQRGLALQAVERLDALRNSILTEDFGDLSTDDDAIGMMARTYYDGIADLVERVAALSDQCESVFQGYYLERQPLASLWDQLRDRHPDLFGDGENSL